MTTVTNIDTGPRGLRTTDRGLVTLVPGETADLSLAKGEDAGVGEWFTFGGAPEVADERPSLTGKNKADLLKIADVEGADVEDDMTNDDIRAAIDLNREG